MKVRVLAYDDDGRSLWTADAQHVTPGQANDLRKLVGLIGSLNRIVLHTPLNAGDITSALIDQE